MKQKKNLIKVVIGIFLLVLGGILINIFSSRSDEKNKKKNDSNTKAGDLSLIVPDEMGLTFFSGGTDLSYEYVHWTELDRCSLIISVFVNHDNDTASKHLENLYIESDLFIISDRNSRNINDFNWETIKMTSNEPYTAFVYATVHGERIYDITFRKFHEDSVFCDKAHESIVNSFRLN